MGWVLTGSKTSDTSRRSFLGQNNNIEMGYHLKKWKKSKLGHPNVGEVGVYGVIVGVGCVFMGVSGVRVYVGVYGVCGYGGCL